MPDVIDHDTLLFASARATQVGSARQVADELLAAANDPDRLRGVDPTLVRVRAADLLCDTGDQQLQYAVAILREAVALALPGEMPMARDALGKALAEQGDQAELAAMAHALLADTASSSWPGSLLGFLSIVSMYGFSQQALRWLDEAVAAAQGGSADRVTRRTLDDIRPRLTKIRELIQSEGADPDDPAAMRRRMRTPHAAAATVSSYRPWPAGADGRLVWWPEREYGRLLRQVPEIATLLGRPWRAHTARVQAASPESLVAAEFSDFAQFLEWSRADPLAPATMTAFGVLATRLPAPVRWPPKDRAPCWCGSGQRYRDCCAR